MKEMHIAILGGFGSGKTTFVNALLGKSVFPCNTMRNEWMTQMRHSSTEYVRAIYADGSEKTFTLDDFFEYKQHRRNTDECITRCTYYLNMTAFKGLCITVLNGDLSGEHYLRFLQEVLPFCDYVVYTTNTTMPYTYTDKDILTALNNYGFRNIIFACTFWEQVALDGEDIMMKAKKYILDNFLQYTDLGEQAVHFISARDGLGAQAKGDAAGYEASGCADFERYLTERYIELC